MLCLAGSLLFAIVTVLQEMMLKTHTCSNYLAILGFIGSLVSCTQTFFMEFNELMAFNWYELETIVQLGSYCCVQTVFQILQCFMLRDAGAIVLHLSFLSSDYYTLVAGMYIFQFKVSVLCFITFKVTPFNWRQRSCLLILCSFLIPKQHVTDFKWWREFKRLFINASFLILLPSNLLHYNFFLSQG